MFLFLLLALMAIMCSGAEPFNNFGRGSPKKHLHETILKLDHWPRCRCRLIFFYFSAGSHLVYWSETILASLIGSQLGIIPVKSE